MEKSKLLVIVGSSACGAISIFFAIVTAPYVLRYFALQRPADPQSAATPGDATVPPIEIGRVIAFMSR